MFAFHIVLGFVLLVAGAELLVRGASGLARRMGISSLVIGLTIVAYGTSAPEMAVSMNAGIRGDAGIALGNVVGSNIFNVLFILGISALIAPLGVALQLIRLDVPVMVAVSIVMWALAWDGSISRTEGLLLLAVIAAYTAVIVWKGREKTSGADREHADLPLVGAWRRLPSLIAAILLGLALLVLGARWLVSGATTLARVLGVSDLIIGLTIVAAGTSLPELATSVIASMRGERDIAVGNVVGSNIFNILAVLGLSAAVSRGGVDIPPAALYFDLPVMVATAVACLPVFFTGGVISRWEGGVFLGYYVAYIAYLILHAGNHRAAAYFTVAFWGFAVPLTLLAVTLSVVQAVRRRQGGTE